MAPPHAKPNASTWEKGTTSRIQIEPPSTKSKVPGVDLKKIGTYTKPLPPRKSKGALATKPLPGSKLRPLQANSKTSDNRSLNTWDPKNRPNVPFPKKPSVAVNATKATLNTSSSRQTGVHNLGQDASPTSRSSSVSSTKQVLPGIKQKSSNLSENDYQQTSISENVPTAESAAESVSDVKSKPEEATVKEQRPVTARKRDLAAVQNRKSTVKDLQQPDLSIDYYMPEWYRNPLLKPEQLKGAVTVFVYAKYGKMKQRPDINLIDLELLSYVKDIKLFMKERIEKSLITIAFLDPKDEKDVKDEKDADSLWTESESVAKVIAPPSCVNKVLAQKANSILDKQYYIESIHDPDVYHPHELSEVNDKLEGEIDFVGYYKEVCDSLGIKSAKNTEELEAMITKAEKRRVNVLKQEKAIHPHAYLEQFESDDIWNHVHTCHSISESCFQRENLMNQLKIAITSAASSDSSPIVISGGLKTGKTWLCAQISSAMADEALTLVRFCGLTSLTSSLPKLLCGLSKQLSAIFHTPVLSPHIAQLSIDNTFELFMQLLNEVSKSSVKPVLLVMDAFDKLEASALDLSRFLSLCKNSMPTNVVLIVSFTSKSQQSEFIDLTANYSTSEMMKELEDERIRPDLLKVFANSAVDTDDMFPENGEAKASEFGLDIATMEECQNKMKELKEKLLDEKDGSTDSFITGMEEYYGYHVKLADHMNNATYDRSAHDDSVEETIKDIEQFKEEDVKLAKYREKVVQRIDADTHVVNEICPEDTKYLDLLENGLDLGDMGQYHIELSDLSTEEAKLFVKHLCKGKLQESEAVKLEEIADYIHNPMLLRLVANKCNMMMPAGTILTAFEKVSSLDAAAAKELFFKILHIEDENVREKILWNEKALLHEVVALLVYDDKFVEREAEDYAFNGPYYMDVSYLRNSDSAKRNMDSQDKPSVSDAHIYSNYIKGMLDGCQLTVFEQADYVHDVERVESLIRSQVITPLALPGISVSAAGVDDIEHFIAMATKRMCNVYKRAMASSVAITDVRTNVQGHLGKLMEIFQRKSEWSFVKEAFKFIEYSHFGEAEHEADTWNDVTVLHEQFGNAHLVDYVKERLPITSALQKNLPIGRDKIVILSLCEFLACRYIYDIGSYDDFAHDAGSRYWIVELMLQYDFLVPLLQEFGVDYVVNSYGRILEIITCTLKLKKTIQQNLLPLEMLYSLLTCYTSQLRENPVNFYTLFLSMFNEDSSLTSRAAMRLYRRVMHEVETRNSLHLTTILSKTGDSSLLSSDAKRYLHNTSEKYAASQCISNKSYILSHNNNNLVKLWELTGEFISAQKLDGHIVCVCPQTSDACFLAVIETVSEVGEKFGSVWCIDRLTHKKLVDIGARTILSAWFDSKGEKLVLIQQCTVDEMRVVVCQPQTMEVKLDDHTINVLPLQITSFMDKSLAIPHKVDDTLLKIMASYLGGNKEDADPTELSLFTSTGDGSSVLKPIAVKKALVFSSLQTLWDDILDKYDAKDDIEYPMKEICSDTHEFNEHLQKMNLTLHGMTSAGDIVVDCCHSDGTHDVLFYKMDGSTITLNEQLPMDEQATMTLMPTDDFVYSDTGSNSGLISWNLPTNTKKIFGNEQKVHVTCLQFEVEEGQILSFTHGQVTVWNAVKKTTESSFSLDRGSDIVAASLQDNWLAISNRDGELSIRFEIRKKMATYHFHEPIDWIDCHVIKDYLYIACHINGVKPSICFLKYRVSDALLSERGKYVVRPEYT